RRDDRSPRGPARLRSVPGADAPHVGPVLDSAAVFARGVRVLGADRGGRRRSRHRCDDDRARAGPGDGARRRDGRSDPPRTGTGAGMIYPVYSALVATALVAGYGPAAVARYVTHGV